MFFWSEGGHCLVYVNKTNLWFEAQDLWSLFYCLQASKKKFNLHVVHSSHKNCLDWFLKWVRYVLLKWKGSLFDLG
jgi:hypothetical protein